MYTFSDDNEDEESPVNEAFVMKLLAQLDGGERPYMDADDLLESYDLLVETGRMDQAKRVLDFALSLHPDNLDVLLTEATLLIDADKIKDAEALLDFVAPRAASDPYFYVNCGWLKLKTDHLEEALQEFKKAVSLPTSDDTILSVTFEIASNLTKMDYSKEAMEFFNMISEKEIENNTTIEFDLAYTLDKIGREDESLSHYEHLLKAAPLNEIAWYNLGILYNRKDRHEEAKDAYNNALAIKPDYPEPSFNLANTMMGEGKFAEAIVLFTDYLAYCPEENLELYAYQYVGECWEQLGQWDLAKRFFELAVKLDPKSDTALYELGRLSLEEQDNKKANDYFTQAIEINKEACEYYFALAQVRINELQLRPALFLLEEGLKLDPHDVFAWFQLVRIYNMIGQDDISKLIARKKKEYGSPTPLLLVEAFVEYYGYKNKSTAAKLVRQVAMDDPNLIATAQDEPDLAMLFDEKEIRKVLTECNLG